MSWLGSAITTGVSLLGGLIGNNAQKKNINRQIRAQQEENQKNREYNLMLAQQQNAWNLEQWERENDYNSPEAQMERYRKAGLNPDLMAGGAQNLSASSPMMTAGAPSTPTDMSMLGQKPTLGQAIQSALRDSMLGAQIDNIKANTRKTLADAGLSETALTYADVKEKLGIQINERVYEKLGHEIDKTFEEARAASYYVEKLNYEQISARLKSLFEERQLEAITKKLENEAKISENDAKLAIESYFYRFLGIKSEAQLTQYHANLPVQLENLFGENAGYAQLILQGVNYLIGNAGNFKTMKSLKK